MTPEAGIHYGISYEDYDSWDAVRHSYLWLLHVATPKHYRWAIDHPRKATPALDFGRRLHHALLEPGLFRSLYVTPPPPPSGDRWDRRLKEHKAHWEAFLAATEAAGQEVLTDDDAACIHQTQAEIERCAAWQLIRQGAATEVSVVWTDAESGLTLKARPDLWSPQAGTLADLKTTRRTTPQSFGRDAYLYGYVFQLAMQYDGLARFAPGALGEPMLFAIESEPPHDIVPYEVLLDQLELGRIQYRRALAVLAECERKNEWPGRTDGIEQLMLPTWAGSELQAAGDERLAQPPATAEVVDDGRPLMEHLWPESDKENDNAGN